MGEQWVEIRGEDLSIKYTNAVRKNDSANIACATSIHELPSFFSWKLLTNCILQWHLRQNFFIAIYGQTGKNLNKNSYPLSHKKSLEDIF